MKPSPKPVKKPVLQRPIQKKKRQFPLRYKLLLVLTLIPVLTLATYLSLAVRIFREDKIAYVFDSSSNFVGTLSSQVRSQIQGVLSDSKPYIQDFVTNQTFSDLSKEQFKQLSSLSLIVSFEFDVQKNIQFKETLLKEGTEEKLILNEVSQLLTSNKKILNDLMTEKRAIAPLGNAEYAFFETVTIDNPEDPAKPFQRFFLLVAPLRDLTQSFLSSRSQKTFLIKSNGDILVGPQAGMTQIEDFIPYESIRQKVEKLAQGVEELTTSKGQEVLMSYSKTGYGDLSVVSVIEKGKALAAVSLLIRRSGYFFGVLICLTVIVSLLASGQLTSALEQVSRATQKVAEGDFKIQVKVQSNDEISVLATNFNLMAQKISKLM
ncbi:MAG: HAMP domain-containing protein, partial [Pseudobdellovibrionaceae bacterium]